MVLTFIVLAVASTTLSPTQYQGHEYGQRAHKPLTYDVGPAGLDPAKPCRDVANLSSSQITLRVQVIFALHAS